MTFTQGSVQLNFPVVAIGHFFSSLQRLQVRERRRSARKERTPCIIHVPILSAYCVDPKLF